MNHNSVNPILYLGLLGCIVFLMLALTGCGMTKEETKSKAEELLAVDKAVIVKDDDSYTGEDINILELQMKDGNTYNFKPMDYKQNSSESFNVRDCNNSNHLFYHGMTIKRDDSLKGNDLYLDCDKDNKYKYVVRYGAINDYSILYVSPDLYDIFVTKFCHSRDDEVVYDSEKTNLSTMSDEQKEFVKDFSENIKVEDN